jgi:hypothetical protein
MNPLVSAASVIAAGLAVGEKFDKPRLIPNSQWRFLFSPNLAPYPSQSDSSEILLSFLEE